MKPTKAQLDKRLQPYRVNRKWFYLGAGRKEWDKCSFHGRRDGASVPGLVSGIPVTAILRALDERGFLDQWDRKTQRLKKVKS